MSIYILARLLKVHSSLLLLSCHEPHHLRVLLLKERGLFLLGSLFIDDILRLHVREFSVLSLLGSFLVVYPAMIFGHRLLLVYRVFLRPSLLSLFLYLILFYYVYTLLLLIIISLSICC